MSKLTEAAVIKIIWKPFEHQFGQQIDAFRSQSKIVEKEAGLSHLIEAADARDQMRAHQLQVSRERNGRNIQDKQNSM